MNVTDGPHTIGEQLARIEHELSVQRLMLEELLTFTRAAGEALGKVATNPMLKMMPGGGNMAQAFGAIGQAAPTLPGM